jgi:hypothetical protein
MKLLRVSLLAMLALTVISACTPDPRKEAQAYATRSEADQSALTQTQQRQQSQDLHAIEMQQKQLEQQKREATKLEWIAAAKRIINAGGYVMAVCVGVIIIYATITIKNTMIGIGNATVMKAEITANLIHLDTNGQFPALIQRMGGGKWSLTDLNTKTTMLLDVRNNPDAQLVAGAIAIRHDVALAHEARLSKDSGENIVTITPPIIHKQIIDARNLLDAKQDVTNE